MILVQLIGVLFVWVSLPLLPAILIYRLFPATPVAVSGPLSGLTIKAGGAFAAYLIVFLIIFPLVQTIEDDIGGSQHSFWLVRGEIKLYDKEGKEIKQAKDLLARVTLRTLPDLLGHENELMILKIPEESLVGFPKIIIDIDKWGQRGIDLNVMSVNKKNNFQKFIDLGQIEIHETPPAGAYNSTLSMDNGITLR